MKAMSTVELKKRNIEHDLPMSEAEITRYKIILEAALEDEAKTLSQRLLISTIFCLTGFLITAVIVIDAAIHLPIFCDIFGTCGKGHATGEITAIIAAITYVIGFYFIWKRLQTNEVILYTESKLAKLSYIDLDTLKKIQEICEEYAEPKAYVSKMAGRAPTRHEAWEIMSWAWKQKEKDKRESDQTEYNSVLSEIVT